MRRWRTRGESELFMDTERGRSAKALARSSLRTRWLRNIRLRPKSMAGRPSPSSGCKDGKGKSENKNQGGIQKMRLPRFSRTALLYSPRLESQFTMRGFYESFEEFNFDCKFDAGNCDGARSAARRKKRTAHARSGLHHRAQSWRV